MKLTKEQKNAVRCNENLMLTACPGSGKTRVIISKLSRVIEEVRGTPRAIVCITYTNAAVNEIEARLRNHIQPGDDLYYNICTIHSFCLNFIFRPFCWLMKDYKKGFKVLTPETPEFEQIVTTILTENHRYNPTFRDFEEFTQLRYDIDGRPVGQVIDHGSLTTQIAIAYWKKIREAGFVDFAGIIYYSLLLIKKRPEIISYLSSKFAWILIDEFQDTTDLQVEILTHIAKAGQTRFLLVGDLNQSIFRFAGAIPELANEFSRRINARTDLMLSGNFRSSPPIITHAELLFPRKPSMKALGSTNECTEVPVCYQGPSSFNVITDYFLPTLEKLDIPIGEAAILAPSWYGLFPLGKRLREYGISIVGPGARPYRRNRLFAPLAEHICGYLIEPRPESISGIERTLFNTLLDMTGKAYFDIYSYKGRVVIFRLIDNARKLYKMNIGAIPWLEAAANEFSLILINEEYLTHSEHDLFKMSVEEIKADMIKNKVDITNMTIDGLGIYASPNTALKLSTLHNAKGREYQAVAIIDINEGKIPYYLSKSAEDIEESKRLFYVGVTRAKRFLLYFTDNSDRRNPPSRFLRVGTGVGLL